MGCLTEGGYLTLHQIYRPLLIPTPLYFLNRNCDSVIHYLRTHLESCIQVTPLTWLEAWLDNYMANVPELAICYHQDGVVQGYELLKTDDIFLLKGISDDGTPAFYPQVVQQNGLSVMRFLQENCKQEPGAYWVELFLGMFSQISLVVFNVSLT